MWGRALLSSFKALLGRKDEQRADERPDGDCFPAGNFCTCGSGYILCHPSTRTCTQLSRGTPLADASDAAGKLPSSSSGVISFIAQHKRES